MTFRRNLTLSAALLGACLAAGAGRAQAADASRQTFVALLTSVKPAPKAAAKVETRLPGSLRAFSGVVTEATPVGRPPNRH